MKLRGWICLLLGIVCSTASAQSDEPGPAEMLRLMSGSTKDLVTACRGPMSGRNQSADPMRRAICTGYFVGASEMLRSTGEMCSSASLQDIAAVVLRSIESEPRIGDVAANKFVALRLAIEWPCRAKP